MIFRLNFSRLFQDDTSLATEVLPPPPHFAGRRHHSKSALHVICSVVFLFIFISTHPLRIANKLSVQHRGQQSNNTPPTSKVLRYSHRADQRYCSGQAWCVFILVASYYFCLNSHFLIWKRIFVHRTRQLPQSTTIPPCNCGATPPTPRGATPLKRVSADRCILLGILHFHLNYLLWFSDEFCVQHSILFRDLILSTLSLLTTWKTCFYGFERGSFIGKVTTKCNLFLVLVLLLNFFVKSQL